jgi:hypothetical protein
VLVAGLVGGVVGWGFASSVVGAAGVDGTDGTDGTDGADGSTGATGAAGLNGAAGTAGDDGARGATGATGATGPARPAGPAGPPGPAAVLGTPIRFDGTVGSLSGTGTFKDGATITGIPAGTTLIGYQLNIVPQPGFLTAYCYLLPDSGDLLAVFYITEIAPGASINAQGTAIVDFPSATDLTLQCKVDAGGIASWSYAYQSIYAVPLS